MKTFKTMLMRVPFTFCGVNLAIASLGNLLSAILMNQLKLDSAAMVVHSTLEVLASVFLILILFKMIVQHKMLFKMIQEPDQLGVLATFPMTLSILAGYYNSLKWSIAGPLWWLGFLLHFCIMIYFIYKFIFVHFDLKSVLPPWYIVFTGFAISGFNSKDFAPEWLGKIFFWIGCIAFVLLFFLILYRIKRYPLTPMDRPMLCINAAIGICLVSYTRNIAQPLVPMVFFLYFGSLLIWIWIVVHLPKWLKYPFYPSDAAFSFPFVISAVSSMETQKALMAQKIMISSWNMPIVYIQTAVATVMVIYTFIRFFRFSDPVSAPLE